MPQVKVIDNRHQSAVCEDLILCCQELVGSSPTQKNWRGILIALLVIIVVCSLIVVAVILVTPKDKDEVILEPFTFDEIVDSQYKIQTFESKWVGEKDMYIYRSREGELMVHDINNNTTLMLMDNSTFRHLNTESYSVSPDLRYILVAHDIDKLYRYTFNANYKLYDRNKAKMASNPLEFPKGSGPWKDQKLQLVKWAPTDNALTFVYGNNLYYQAGPDSDAVQVTTSGHPINVFNGIPDWVYEEEILHGNTAHWVSPTNSYICYATFNDTLVPVYKFPDYGYGNNIYGDIKEISYPKAGNLEPNTNPTFTLKIVTTENPTSMQKELKRPSDLENQDIYFTMAKWLDDSRVLVAWANRAQNKSIITVCDAVTAECQVNHITTSSEGRGWVKRPTTMPIEGGSHYLMVTPVRDGAHGYFRHVAMVSAPIGETGVASYLTQGTWDVSEILGYDSVEKYVYYTGTTDPKELQLYKVKTPDVKSTTISQSECLTCNYNKTICSYISASFSHSASYYIETCKGPGIPTDTLRSTTSNFTITLEDNAKLEAQLTKKTEINKTYESVEVSDGTKIWAQLYLPPQLDIKHITQYPVLIDVYNGPETQRVTAKYKIDWFMYLVSTRNVIYISIDGRGTNGRGDRFRHAVHRQFGTLEVQDQIEVARLLSEKLSYIDKDRIAIWGWSYGGFVTAHVLGDTSSIIKCGIAVAPATDWRYYDTAYSERYMGFPNDDNYRGYDNANVSRKVTEFKDKHFMLIHGTGDDNVHFQHSAQFIKALTEAEIDYRLQVYPDKTHSLSGTHTRRHLYRSMGNFLSEECWNGGAPKNIVVKKNKKGG